ncbi:cell envelope biogenesis protein TolA [Sphingobium sp. BYY-5]|uniref:cell envelope biogenesis protein TolA n=1 Tax=Sphingobium sp. BYY-5 TaxID=2926400 RepID=UPI001FA80388|nr:cell envelope biogenesis protein TolA [Sphingobium sp. BYY-5]MCI4590963.1 cell envelope biogenesis protein TolA [Sphingobium sp. BYY-5]
MERAEKIGLGVATAGHVLLFGLLSAGFLATPNPLKLKSPPMDISLVDEVALQSTAPQISTQPPPPSVAPEQGPTEDAKPAPVPEPPQPQPTPAPPQPRPVPPQPRPVVKAQPPKPQERPAPAKKDVAKTPAKPAHALEKPAPKAKPAPEKPRAAAAPSRPAKSDAKAKSDAPARASGAGKADKPKGSLLGKDFLKGIDTTEDAPRKAAPPPAAAIGPQQKAALDAEIRRQLKPHWRAPSGADADKLVTLLEVRLDKNGGLIGTPEVIDQLGVTASNQPQAKLHAERAIQAVKLAAPFRNLPPEYYDQWKWLRPLRFDARLNR